MSTHFVVPNLDDVSTFSLDKSKCFLLYYQFLCCSAGCLAVSNNMHRAINIVWCHQNIDTKYVIFLRIECLQNWVFECWSVYMSYQKDVWMCIFRRPDVNNMRIPNVRKTEYLNVDLSGCRAKRTSWCVFLDIQMLIIWGYLRRAKKG